MQRQPKLTKAILQCADKCARFTFPLEPNNAVVRIAYNDDITGGVLLPPAMCPQIEDVVQINVGQQRGNDRALRRAPGAGFAHSLFNHPCFQPLLDQPEQPSVSNAVGQEAHHPAVINAVKERADICVQDPADLASANAIPHRIERVMLPAPWSKSIRETQEVCFINGAQQCCHRLLHHLVFQRSNPQRPLLAVRLLDVDPPRSLGSIRPGV